jgi:AraC-like DNA-binding protein
MCGVKKKKDFVSHSGPRGAKVEPIKYEDGNDWRILDLRPDGCDCIPLLAKGSFKAVRDGVDMHVHPGHVEISLCLKGNIRYETESGEYQLLPGRLFVSKPQEPHRRCNNPKGMLMYRLLFAVPEKKHSVLGLDREESKVLVDGIMRFPFKMCPSSTRVRTAFERLFTLYDNAMRDTPMRRMSMKNAAIELLLALIELPSLPPSPLGRPNPRIKAVVERMKAHPEYDFPVEELAAEAALSSVAFTESFKRATGLTPHAYLLDVRVNRARADLADPRTKISTVAARYRFPSPQHFATIFKRIIGVTPRECRR